MIRIILGSQQRYPSQPLQVSQWLDSVQLGRAEVMSPSCASQVNTPMQEFLECQFTLTLPQCEKVSTSMSAPCYTSHTCAKPGAASSPIPVPRRYKSLELYALGDQFPHAVTLPYENHPILSPEY